MMEAFCTHPNVGAVLLVSLGCEQFNRPRLMAMIRASGRPVELVVIQKTGGTRATIAGRTRLGARGARRDRRGAARCRSTSPT